jgi:hypothetical protein|nr:MAG TPA: hypothetical protein [Caudoviricetes sp.]
MNKFAIKKPQGRVVIGSISEKVNDIIDNTKNAQLDIGLTPKVDVNGKVYDFESSRGFIRRETRKYRMFDRVLELEGTVYGIDKNETTGKYGATFFQPDFANPEDIKGGKVTADEVLKRTFETMRDLHQLMLDLKYWEIPARCLTDVANNGTGAPEYKGYVGLDYAFGLLTNEDVKFTRIMSMQYEAGERDIAKDLICMLTGENIEASSIVPITTSAPAFVNGDDVTNVFTDIRKPQTFGAKLPAHGIVQTPKFNSVFGGAGARSEAGDEAIKGGFGKQLKKK